MKVTIAFCLLIIGSLLVLYGIGFALYELAMLYQSNITDPLTMSGEDPKAVSARMWRSILIGLAGVPFMITGSVILQVGVFKWLARKLDGGSKQS